MATTNKQREAAVNKGIRNGKKELAGIVSDRRKVIKATILTATSEPNFITSATAQNALYGDLRNEYKRLNDDINGWTMKNGTITSKEARKLAVLDLPKGTKVGTFDQFSRKHLDNIIGSINPSTVDKQVALNAKIGGMYDRDIQIFRSTVSSVNAIGAVEGMTSAEMTTQMVKDIKGQAGNLQFIDRAGRTWSADTYFSMLNQTMHQKISRDSYNLTVTDAGYDLVRIEGGVTGSSADNPEDPCDHWAGEIISLTGSTEGFKTMQDALDAGVFHPRCSHFTSVLTPSERNEAMGESVKSKPEPESVSKKEEPKQATQKKSAKEKADIAAEKQWSNLGNLPRRKVDIDESNASLKKRGWISGRANPFNGKETTYNLTNIKTGTVITKSASDIKRFVGADFGAKPKARK